MRSRIATILLRAGNPGWYDSLTNIHLTIARPQAYVYEGSNTINIKNAINHGLINVIEGSLDNSLPSTENPNVGSNEFYVYGEPETLVRESEANEEVVPTEAVKEEKLAEEVKEVTEEIAEEKPKKKTTSKKKSTTKKEEK